MRYSHTQLPHSTTILHGSLPISVLSKQAKNDETVPHRNRVGNDSECLQALWASDGFWITFNIITEAVTQRSDCSGKEVTDMVKSAFKELARTDSAFDEAF